MNIQDVYKDLSITTFFSAFHRLGSSYMSKQMKSFNLGHGHQQFLMALYIEDGITQDELTKRIATDKVTTARAISKLKEEGYVLVEVDSKDKRCHRVMLSKKAYDIREDFTQAITDWQKQLLNNLTEEEEQVLLRLCHKIVEGKSE